MFLLETNVVSESRRGRRGDPGVVAWSESVAITDLYISALVLGEIRKGIARLRLRRDYCSGVGHRSAQPFYSLIDKALLLRRYPRVVDPSVLHKRSQNHNRQSQQRNVKYRCEDQLRRARYSCLASDQTESYRQKNATSGRAY